MLQNVKRCVFFFYFQRRYTGPKQEFFISFLWVLRRCIRENLIFGGVAVTVNSDEGGSHDGFR